MYGARVRHGPHSRRCESVAGGRTDIPSGMERVWVPRRHGRHGTPRPEREGDPGLVGLPGHAGQGGGARWRLRQLGLTGWLPAAWSGVLCGRMAVMKCTEGV